MKEKGFDSVKQKIACMFGRHSIECVNNVILFLDAGYVIHDHICLSCPWTKAMPDRQLTDSEFAKVNALIPKRKTTPKPLMN